MAALHSLRSRDNVRRSSFQQYDNYLAPRVVKRSESSGTNSGLVEAHQTLPQFHQAPAGP